MQELDVHDEVRRKFLQHQGEMKRMQLQRLDDEMKRKVHCNYLCILLYW